MATLRITVVEGPDAGVSATLAGERMVLGRSAEADFTLHDDSASRRHLAIERDGERFVLVDLGSHNGTFVEGDTAKVSRRELVGGERIRIGRTILSIDVKEATAGSRSTGAPSMPAAASATAVLAQKPADLPIVLTIVSGPDRGMVYSPSKAAISIGRRANCDVPLEDAAASRLHATIKREGDGYVLYDENSRYGTFLVSANKAVFHAPLRNDDVIRIGDTQIRVSIGTVAQAITSAEPSLSATIRNKTFSMTIRGLSTQPVGGEATIAARAPIGDATVAATRPPASLVLVVASGNDRGRRIPIAPGARLTVGRGDKAGVRIADPAVSSIHLSLREESGAIGVRDEGSRNGTFVPGSAERITETTLRPGDGLRIGATELRLEDAAAPSAPVLTPDATVAMAGPPPGAAAPPAPSPGPQPPAAAPAAPGAEKAAAPPPPAPSSPQKPADRVPELARHADAKQRISKIMKGVSLRPIRKAGTARQWATVAAVVLAALTCLALPRTWISAGPVHEGHADIEAKCESCHAAPASARLLTIAGFHTSAMAMDASCATSGCHAKQLKQHAGVRDDCISCHVEHRGRSFPIRGGENLCWSCHRGQASPQDFDTRLMKVSFTKDAALKTRLAAKLRPPLETGLRFSHEAHDKETHGDARFDACSGCHAPTEKNRSFALPSHAQCIECHAKAVSADVKAAAAKKGPDCLECHTREDGEMAKLPPARFAYVSFSHADHKDEFCKSCHASVWKEGPYQKVKRATDLFPVAMDACYTCHRQKNATVACLDCHREHHSFAPAVEAAVVPGGGGGGFDRWLLGVLVLALGGVGYVYADARLVRSWLARSEAPPPPPATGAAQPAAGAAAAEIMPFPKVDVEACISCSSCYNSCPKQVLAGDDHGKSTVVNPDSCIALEGCAICEQGCPTGAIRVSTAPLKRTVERPDIDEHNEAKIPGIFFAGEVIGAALIKSAINQGNQDVAYIAEKKPKIADASYDVIVVGAGPAGLGAGLEAKRRGLRYLVLERDTIASTIKNYPRDKAVLAEPVKMPLYGQLPMMDADKDTLMAVWQTIVKTTGLDVKEFEEVLEVKKVDALLEVTTSKATYRAANVILAIGTRGNPRKLGCAGECAERVAYNLIDAAELRGKSVIVVGGGDSAIEAAVALGKQEGTTVILSYRKGEFSRVKKRNLEQIEEFSKAGRVEVLFNSSLVEIGPENVRVKTQAGERAVVCHQVFALIGADPPKAWIEKLGVAFVMREEEVVTWS